MNDLVDAADALLMRDRLRALKNASMMPGSWEKRFIRDVAERDPASLTIRQTEAVMRLAWKFRRQIPGHLAPESDPGPMATAKRPARPARPRARRRAAAHEPDLRERLL